MMKSSQKYGYAWFGEDVLLTMVKARYKPPITKEDVDRFLERRPDIVVDWIDEDTWLYRMQLPIKESIVFHKAYVDDEITYVWLDEDGKTCEKKTKKHSVPFWANNWRK